MSKDNESKTVVRGGGISFFGLLTIVLITLKLLDVIDWSWLWVLAPIWAPLAVIPAVMAVIGLFGLIAAVISALLKR